MIRTPFCLAILLSALVLGAQARQAHATSMRYKSIRELVQNSDVTLLGEPIDSQSFWQGTRIMTRVRVRVQEVWAGRAPQRAVVEVLTAGGVVGDIGQRVDGAAVLPEGHQMVLHLRQYEGDYWPTAMAQGVWVLRRDSREGALLRPGADRMSYGLKHQQDRAQAGEAAQEPKTLDALRAAVREASRGR